MSDSVGVSPPPDGVPPPSTTTGNPPHFKVGLGFVKAYYKTLTEQPDKLVNFYKAGTSYLGHGEGSTVADPKPLEEYDLSIQQRWGCDDNQKMRFDFEYGAIDTQPVSESVLLVVTAQVFFESPNNGNVSSAGEKVAEAKSFVQTFFLVREGRNFSCYNDILRFVELPTPKSKGPSTPTATVSTNTISTRTADVAVATEDTELEKVDQVDEASPKLTNELETSMEAPPALAEEDEAPGGGVEESKEEAPEEEDEVPSKPVEQPIKDGRGKKNKGGPKVHQQQEQQQQQQKQSANKPVPGSWASLVASGGSAPNTPSRKPAPVPESEKGPETPATAAAPPPEEKVQPKDTPNEKASTTTKDDTVASTATTSSGSVNNNNNNKPSSKGQPFPQRPKRDPDNTLVVKNLSDNIKESDIINMFKPFAVQTNSKIVGTNLNHHRGLAFVDFDQVAPVKAALAKHQETPFQWNGKVLEVDQKTLEVRARRQKAGGGSGGGGGGGGYHRSGSPGNGFRNSGTGRTGGDHRRGDRGGGGRRSGRGGRGGR